MPKEADTGKSYHAIVIEFGVGKTQVHSIVKEREGIMIGECSDRKYSKPRKAGYEDLDKIVFK